MKRLFKHGQLNPIPAEKSDQPRLQVDPTKSMDLSRVIDNPRIHSETPKLSDLNKSLDTSKDHANNLSMSKGTLDNPKLPKQKKAEDTRKSLDKKKFTELNKTVEVDSDRDNSKTKSKAKEKKETQQNEKQEAVEKKQAPKKEEIKTDEQKKEKNNKEQPKQEHQQPDYPRREVKGRTDSTLEEFNDDKIPQGKKLNRITFWYDDNRIYGLKAFYSLSNGSDMPGKEQLKVADKTKLKSASMELASDDHISYIMGTYKQSIGYIKIITAKGKTHEFGNLKGNNVDHDFVFDIEAKEYPISIFGALDTIGGGGSEDCALAYVGFTIDKWGHNDEIKEEIH